MISTHSDAMIILQFCRVDRHCLPARLKPHWSWHGSHRPHLCSWTKGSDSGEWSCEGDQTTMVRSNDRYRLIRSALPHTHHINRPIPQEEDDIRL
jgi:hypothetical protein